MMGKIISRKLIPADDPMFSEGWSTFFIRSPRLKKTSPKDTASPPTETSTPESQSNSEKPTKPRG